MRRRTTSYDKSYVGSSGPGLKSGNLRKRAQGPASAIERADNLAQLAVARRGAGFVRDLIAQRTPIAARRDAVMEGKALALDVFDGRLSLTEAIGQLRGAA
jgi:hypothetical protein